MGQIGSNDIIDGKEQSIWMSTLRIKEQYQTLDMWFNQWNRK
jgi:hypothetical protein